MYQKGEFLFKEGSRPHSVYCINKGKLKVFQTGKDGKEQLLYVATEGDLLGYRSLISDDLHYESAQTLEECNVCVIPKSDFLTLLNESDRFKDNMLKEACKKMGYLSSNITVMAQKSVRERSALVLLMLCDTYDTAPYKNGPIEINLTREDLANMVGTATETLIRQLHDFKEEKLVETKGRKINVINKEGLVKVANLL